MKTEILAKFTKTEILEYLKAEVFVVFPVRESVLLSARHDKAQKRYIAAMEANKYPLTEEDIKNYNAACVAFNSATTTVERLAICETMEGLQAKLAKYNKARAEVERLEKIANAAWTKYVKCSENEAKGGQA